MSMPAQLVSTKILSLELVEQLKQSGISIACHNFIQTIIRIPNQATVSRCHQYIVLTSKNAVRAWLAIAEKYSIPLADHLIFCTDKATRQEAVKHQLSVIGTAPNAESLAGVIARTSQVKAVTFICSNQRRDELPMLLKAGGIIVHEINCYHTELTPLKINDPYDSVLFFSPSGVDSFLSLNKIAPICFCIGATTAAHASERGFSEIQIAESATPESMIKKVIHYYKKDTVHA